MANLKKKSGPKKRICLWCSNEFQPNRRGAPPKYCSDKCVEAQRYQRDKEKRLEASKKYCRRYYERNREEVRARGKAWTVAHPEASSQHRKAYRERNLSKIRAKGREIAKRDRDKRRSYKSEYRKKHPEKEREYKTRNRERLLPNYRRYRSIRRTRQTKAGGSFTKQEWLDLLDTTGHKCLCCDLRCVKLTVDHIIPVVRGGTSNIENIQPLCTPCNSKKRDKIVDYRGQRG